MATDKSQSSFHANPGDVQQRWLVIDAKGHVLGRLAQEIATILMGKHRPSYTANTDTGDFVVILNAGLVDVTGSKRTNKEYDRFSSYPGGHKIETFESLNNRRPGEPLRLAVRRMLPKNTLGRHMLKKLKIYAGTEHPHIAQNPIVYEPTDRGRRGRSRAKAS